MELTLLLIGIIFILFGFIASKRKSLRQTQPSSLTVNELDDYQQAIQNSHLEFRQQFEFSQVELQNLYAPDFFRIINKLERIENKLDEVLNQNHEQIKQPHESKDLENLKPNIEIDEFLQKRIDMYQQLVVQEKSIEEIAKLLNVGKGEVLLLRNLSEKIAQQ